ncbi:uncharacterized protein LOC126717047 isoform X3 [Quercus robur]|uniref:uncharacterized protein LOC126717047 isoform X3 n=1 Tax=Quercus robur TaxID=38942 RepID=UPI0021638080|nr:uncharacterized protein LOC126717047 isoform X3 [Quercus robur]
MEDSAQLGLTRGDVHGGLSEWNPPHPLWLSAIVPGTLGHGEDYQFQLAVDQCPKSCIHYITPSQRFILEELLDRIWTGDWRGGLINGNGMAFAFPKHIMDVLVASLKQEVYSEFRGLKLFFTKAWAMLHLNIYLMQR